MIIVISEIQRSDSGGHSSMSFIPDASRSKVVSSGEFHPQHVVRYREAMSALHDVVVNDQRFVPKDRSEYLAWRAARTMSCIVLAVESEALRMR